MGDAIEVYDLIRDIKDPEHPFTLEQLRVVDEEQIQVEDHGEWCHVTLRFTPTVTHCTLASLIGLCIRAKLERDLPKPAKVDIYLVPGSHDTEADLNKQINDKERVQAAMENEFLRTTVENCIAEPE